MANLMVYLQADSTRDAPLDLFRGETLLVQKECLKCHRFRGESRMGNLVGFLRSSAKSP